MTPMDAIWLVLVKTLPLPATSWLPPHPVGVLLVLATPVKLSKMAGNSASYSPNSWWVDRLQIAIESWQISCKHLLPFRSYNTLNN